MSENLPPGMGQDDWVPREAHTPEPWFVDDFGDIRGGTAYPLHNGRDYYEQACKALGVSGGNGASESNARRIVACVNACAGISTEDLEGGPALRDLRRDRNKFLIALTDIISAIPAQLDGGGFIVEHFSSDGEYLGSQNIDPAWVAQVMVEIASSAIAGVERPL